MTEKKGKQRTPLFHIVKRKSLPWYQAWAIRAAAIVLALVVCAVVTTLLTGEDPLQVYATIFRGAFGTPRKIWVLLQNIAILLCVSLAVTPAFRMRFWNVGGEGQLLMGGLATAACMICLGDKLPNGLLILLMVIVAAAAGGIWGVIPAIFKAKWNTNETQGRRTDRHHQSEHRGRLAALDLRAEISAEHSGGGHPHRAGLYLSELQQARL